MTVHTDSDDDVALVRRFLATRSQDVFAAMYARHAATMFGLAVRLNGRTEADDVVQEAWLRAIRTLSVFGGRSSLRTWLCGIVVNCCRERWRIRDMESIGDSPPVVTAPDVALDVEAALERLAPGYRAVVVLYDVYGYTHLEIARMLGCDVGTSKSQLSRARRALKLLLEPRQAVRKS